MSLVSSFGPELFVLGRLFFGGLLAFQAGRNLLNPTGPIDHARKKAVPKPELSVIGASVILLLGGLGITLGVYPSIAALCLIVFFVVVTPIMHNFWAVPEEEKPAKLNHFIENLELLGASIVFLVLSSQPWEYALNIGF